VKIELRYKAYFYSTGYSFVKGGGCFLDLILYKIPATGIKYYINDVTSIPV